MRLEKNKTGKWLIYFQIIYNCFIKFAIGHLHIPSYANYLTDVVTALLLLLMINGTSFRMKKSRSNLLIAIFVCSTIIAFIANGYSILLYIWGARNVFRFFIFFYACIYFFEEKDVIKLFDLLEKICWANIVMALFQRYVLRYIGDGSSGFYSLGNMSGGNGSLNIIFCVVLGYQLSKFLVHKIQIRRIALTLLGTIVVAVSIELKYFFVELLVIVFVFLAIQKATTRNLIVTIGIIVAVLVGMDYLTKIYPEWANVFSLDSMIENSQGYGDEQKIGRLSGISFIYNNYLSSPLKKLFGIGLGNADYSSSFGFLTSNFYRMHPTLGYEYFQSAFLTLENGLVGLVVYALWLIEPFRVAWKARSEKTIYIYMALLFSIIAALQLIYNQMLRVETSGYLMALCLAIIYIHEKTSRGYNNGKNH